MWDPFPVRRTTYRRRYDPFFDIPSSFDHRFDLPREFRRTSVSNNDATTLPSDDACQVVADAQHFFVSIDVHDYKPDEVKVSIHDEDADNAFITVKGEHGERSDAQGYISRQFTRRVALPTDVDPKKLECEWSADNGCLTLKVSPTLSR